MVEEGAGPRGHRVGGRLPLRRPLPHGRGARSGALGGGVERAGTLLRTTAALLHLAESNDLWLVGIGKTQRAGFFTDALATGTGAGEGNRRGGLSQRGQWRAGGGGGAPEGERLGDGELLAIAPAGWSWPLVLDGTRFPVLSRAAGEALGDCPAIVSCYLRPHPADLPLRVDIPAGAVGLDDRLLPLQAPGPGRPGCPTPTPCAR